MTTPPVAVVARGPLDPAVVRLLACLAERWPVQGAALAENRVALVHVEGGYLAAAPDVPWVAVVHSADGARDATRDGAALVLAVPGSEAAGLGLWVLPEHDGVPEARPASPYVRERLRALRGHHGSAIALADDDGWRWDEGGPDGELHADEIASTAAAVLATGPALVQALAWGTPAVTDEATALAWDAVAGRDVVVAAPGRELAAARTLPARAERAAELSWAGRRLYEHRHDPRRLVLDVLTALHLDAPRPGHPYQRLELVVDALGIPPGSPVRTRVHHRVVGSLPAPEPATAEEVP